MPENTLRELFLEELQDMYNAEKQLTRALPKMAKAAESEDLQEAFTAHLEETEGQIVRLERVFESLGEKVKGKKCEGMEGIIEEGSGAIEEFEGAVSTPPSLRVRRRLKHYEITSYGSLATFCELLGHRDAKTRSDRIATRKRPPTRSSRSLPERIISKRVQSEAMRREQHRRPKPASAGRGGNGRGNSVRRAKN